MGLVLSATASGSNSYRLSSLEIKASHRKSMWGRRQPVHPALETSVVPASITFYILDLAFTCCSRSLICWMTALLFFFFLNFSFSQGKLNKSHNLVQDQQMKIQIQGCLTLITVHWRSISCLYLELMRIHHACQIRRTPNSNVKPNVRGHTFPLLTKSVIHKYYCYQTLHLQHLFRNMHM